MATILKPADVPPVPFPENNLPSLLAAVVALKLAVESLQGIRGSKPASRVFVQNDPPTAVNRGDLWFIQNPTAQLSYWTGTDWQLFATTHADGSLHST